MACCQPTAPIRPPRCKIVGPGMSFQSLVAPSCSLHVASLQPPNAVKMHASWPYAYHFIHLLRPLVQCMLPACPQMPPKIQDARKLALGITYLNHFLFVQYMLPACSPQCPQDASNLALGMSFQSLVAPSCSLQVANLQPPLPPRCKQVGPRHVISITCCALPYIACCQPTAPKCPPRCKQVGPRQAYHFSYLLCPLNYSMLPACSPKCPPRCKQVGPKHVILITFCVLLFIAECQPTAPKCRQDASKLNLGMSCQSLVMRSRALHVAIPQPPNTPNMQAS